MKNKKFWILIGLNLFIIFVIFSYFVAKEVFTKADFDTTVKFQDNFPPGVNYPFSLFSVLGQSEITGIFWLILLALMFIKKYYLAFLGLFLLPIALVIELFGKVFLYHPSPPHLFYRGVIKFDFPTHFVHTQYSYPSGHMLRTAFLVSFISVWLLLKYPLKKHILIQLILYAILVLMFVSRIYLGEHWTTDVIGGLLLGSSFGIISASLIPIQAKQKKEHNVNKSDQA